MIISALNKCKCTWNKCLNVNKCTANGITKLIQLNCRLIGCENAIGIMTKLQTSLAAEETWVDGATEKLSALPTATSALELDVSTNPCHSKHLFFIKNSPNHTHKNSSPFPVSVHLSTEKKYSFFSVFVSLFCKWKKQRIKRQIFQLFD